MIAERNNIKVFVSFTVYDFENTLDDIYTLLDTYGYDVLMSHKGTIPLDSHKSNLENCLEAVSKSDVFVGIIRPLRGSGVLERDGKSITEYEFEEAFKMNIPRFILVDRDVEFARRFLKCMNIPYDKIPYEVVKHKGGQDVMVKNEVLHSTSIGMYEMAIRSNLPPVARVGNWVQSYHNFDDIRMHLESQFQYVSWIKKLMEYGKQ